MLIFQFFADLKRIVLPNIFRSIISLRCKKMLIFQIFLLIGIALFSRTNLKVLFHFSPNFKTFQSNSEFLADSAILVQEQIGRLNFDFYQRRSDLVPLVENDFLVEFSNDFLSYHVV